SLLGRRFLVVALLAAVIGGVTALSAGGRPRGPNGPVSRAPVRPRLRGTNGQIAFGRFTPLLGDQQVYVVNPDGVGGARLVQGPNDIGESPMWFPDGLHVGTGGGFGLPGGGSGAPYSDD